MLPPHLESEESDFVELPGTPADAAPLNAKWHEPHLGTIRLTGTDDKLTRLRMYRSADADKEALSTSDDPKQQPDDIEQELLFDELCLSNVPAVAGGGSYADGDEEGTTAAAAAAEPLPFEDARFAEKILEMEIDGAIDPSWQDRPKAAKEDVVELCRILREMKVRDVVAIDTSSKTGSFDYILFGTCEGARHIALAAWAVSEADRYERSSKPKRRKSDDLWDVVTCGRILVNLMQASYRETVALERKWALTTNMDPKHAARGAVSEGRINQVHGLWTLTVNLQDLEDFEVDYCKDLLLGQM